MKLIKIVFLLLFLGQLVQAQVVPTGDFSVSTSDGQRFYLYLDDISQNPEMTNTVVIHNVVKGLHKASFRFETEGVQPLIGHAYIYQGMNSTYVIEPFAQNAYQLRALSVTPLFNKEREHDHWTSNTCVGMSEPDFQTALQLIKSKPFDDVRLTLAEQITSANYLTARQITRLCTVFNFDDSRLLFAKYAYPYCCDKNNYYLVNGSFKFSSSTDDLAQFIAAQPPVPINPNPDNNKGNGDRDGDRHREGEHHDNDGNRNNGNMGCVPMDAINFQAAKETIASKGFEDTKVEVAKSVIQSNCMTTDQIVQVCRLFSYESSMLDFAKFAYSYCADKNNYYKVSNVFDYDSSVNELQEYIKTK